MEAENTVKYLRVTECLSNSWRDSPRKASSSCKTKEGTDTWHSKTMQATFSKTRVVSNLPSMDDVFADPIETINKQTPLH